MIKRIAREREREREAKMNALNAASDNKPKLVLICRLCGEASSSYVNIFGREGTEHSLSGKISLYLKVEVSNSDLLPKIICNKCFCKLEEFHNFFLAGAKVQQMLKSAISDSNKLSIKINIGSLKSEARNENVFKIDRGSGKNVSFVSQENKDSSDKTCVESICHSNKDPQEDKNMSILESFGNPSDKELLPFHIMDEGDYQEILDFIDGKTNDADENKFEMTNEKNDSLSKENIFNYSNTTDNFFFHDNSNNNNIDDINMALCPTLKDAQKEQILTGSTTVGNSSESESVLEKDFNAMHMTVRLPCLACNEVFMKPKELIIHSKQEHCNETPIFRCRICGNLSKDLEKFSAHYHNHENIKYTCKICGKSFGRHWTLQAHAAVHTDTKSYNCDECNKLFKTINSLRQHKKKHLPDECKPKYICTQCGESFKSKFTLTSHERIHTGQKDFSCDTCGKSFIKKSLLRYHMFIHNNKENFTCHLCHKLFDNHKMLERHLIVHFSGKPFKCEFCGKQYTSSTFLKQHIRLHTGELPYKCKDCPKRFRVRQALTTHQRQHTGVKPYECKMCDRAFTDFSNFKKHMKRKHNSTNIIEKNELILVKV